MRHPDDPSQLSRGSDPGTSKKAAREVFPKIGDLHMEVLAYVKKTPGLTAMELAQLYSPKDPRHIGRRLPELEIVGMVYRLLGDPCKVTGKSAYRWWPK